MLLDTPIKNYEQIDVFIFENKISFPNIIKEIKTDENETNIIFHDELISNYEILDKNNVFSNIYPFGKSVILDKEINTVCVNSKSKITYQDEKFPSHHLQVWHMNSNELELILKYQNTGCGYSLDRHKKPQF